MRRRPELALQLHQPTLDDRTMRRQRIREHIGHPTMLPHVVSGRRRLSGLLGCMTTTTLTAPATDTSVVTVLPVMYRDGDNYKRHDSIIVAGEFTPADIEALRSTLDEGEHYAPVDVGLPHLLDESDWSRNDSDHCWHELSLDRDLDVRPLRLSETIAFESAAEMIAKFAEASAAGWPAQFR